MYTEGRYNPVLIPNFIIESYLGSLIALRTRNATGELEYEWICKRSPAIQNLRRTLDYWMSQRPYTITGRTFGTIDVSVLSNHEGSPTLFIRGWLFDLFEQVRTVKLEPDIGRNAASVYPIERVDVYSALPARAYSRLSGFTCLVVLPDATSSPKTLNFEYVLPDKVTVNGHLDIPLPELAPSLPGRRKASEEPQIVPETDVIIVVDGSALTPGPTVALLQTCSTDAGLRVILTSVGCGVDYSVDLGRVITHRDFESYELLVSALRSCPPAARVLLVTSELTEIQQRTLLAGLVSFSPSRELMVIHSQKSSDVPWYVRGSLMKFVAADDPAIAPKVRAFLMSIAP